MPRSRTDSLVHIDLDKYSVHTWDRQVAVTSARQFLRLTSRAAALRATAATGSNAHSSRSHAVCRIYVNAGGGGGGGEGAEAVLQLVDLAGAEDARDSAGHDAARRRESAQINTSLAMLQVPAATY